MRGTLGPTIHPGISHAMKKLPFEFYRRESIQMFDVRFVNVL